MKKLEEFLNKLSATDSGKIVKVAAEMLMQPFDWSKMAADYINRLPEATFVSLVQKMNIQLVEPRVLMIHEEEKHFQVIVHLFNLNSFNRLMAEGKIGPHFHHFSFATRILHGGYWNINYGNSGTVQKPELFFKNQSYCDPGTVYTLKWDAFHQVLRPQHYTVSLMVRSKPIYEVDHGIEKNYGKREILRKRRLLLSVLNGPTVAVPGKPPIKSKVDFSKILA